MLVRLRNSLEASDGSTMLRAVISRDLGSQRKLAALGDIVKAVTGQASLAANTAFSSSAQASAGVLLHVSEVSHRALRDIGFRATL